MSLQCSKYATEYKYYFKTSRKQPKSAPPVRLKTSEGETFGVLYCFNDSGQVNILRERGHHFLSIVLSQFQNLSKGNFLECYTLAGKLRSPKKLVIACWNDTLGLRESGIAKRSSVSIPFFSVLQKFYRFWNSGSLLVASIPAFEHICETSIDTK